MAKRAKDYEQDPNVIWAVRDYIKCLSLEDDRATIKIQKAYREYAQILYEYVAEMRERESVFR